MIYIYNIKNISNLILNDNKNIVKRLIIFLLLFSPILAAKVNLTQWETLKCDADLCLDIEDGKIIYTSKKDIYGLKFKHNNCLGSIIGGELKNNKFNIQKTEKIFEARPTTTPFIPSGTGILVEFNEVFYQFCLIEMVFYEDGGWVLSHDFNPIYGCTDDNACNFNPKANNSDNSCTYPEKHYNCNGDCIDGFDCFGICGGLAIIDQCGICDGDNTSCADCAGTPNGDAIEDNCVPIA